MRSDSARIGVGVLGATLLLGAMGFAQQSATDGSKRRVKSKVMPAYPDLTRRMNVTGKVKVEVVISADGRVKSTRVIGGHPLLVPPAVNAAKEWKFLPAAEETTQIVEFDLRGTND